MFDKITKVKSKDLIKLPEEERTYLIFVDSLLLPNEARTEDAKGTFEIIVRFWPDKKEEG